MDTQDDESLETKFAGILVHLRDDFVAAEDAVLDLARFAVAQEDQLDAESGAIQELSQRFLPAEASKATKQSVYAEANRFWLRIRDIQQETETLGEAVKEDVRNEQISEAETALRDALRQLGVNSPIPGLIYQKFRAIQARKRRAPILVESLLITAVSQFENFVAQLISVSLLYDDRPIKDGDRKFSYADIVEHGGSLSKFRMRVVDDHVSRLMRGSLDEWLNFLSKAVRLEGKLRDEIHDSLVEIVQRRHVFVHNGGRVSDLYLKNVGRRAAGLKVGTRLEVNPDYLDEAIEQLSLAGIALSQGAIHAVARKAPRTSEIDHLWGSINEVVFEKMLAKRWYCPSRTFRMVADYLPDANVANLLRVNSWHASRKIVPDESLEKEILDWDVSSLHPRFELAKACLLGNAERADQLAESLLGSGELRQIDVDTWPILECVREYRISGC